MERKKFEMICHKSFQHELEREPLSQLLGHERFRKIHSKFLPQIFQEEGFEEERFRCLASMVKLSEQQCPDIYEIVKDVAAVLDAPMPEVFVENLPVPNAGVRLSKTPIMTLTSALLDSFTDEELRCVIGHQMGHLKCGYTSLSHLANVFLTNDIPPEIVRKLKDEDFAESGFILALQNWNRNTEFSADRASLLAVQNLDIALRASIKLAAGSPTHMGKSELRCLLAPGQRVGEIRRKTKKECLFSIRPPRQPSLGGSASC